MSEIKVISIKGTGASTAAITIDSSAGTCTANITNRSNKNLIINGAYLVAQRSTSSTANGYGSVDRFRCSFSAVSENPTQSQVDVSSGTTPYTLGFRKAFKIQNGNQTTTHGNSNIRLMYRVESQDVANSGWNYLSSSSYVTLSFWIKASVSQNYYGFLLNEDTTQNVYPFETGSLTANTWTKITKTIPGNSNLTFNNDTGAGLRVSVYGYLGTDLTSSSMSLNSWTTYDGSNFTPDNTSTWFTTNDATLEFTGFQLELGSVATDFEHLSYAEQFRRCARYCYQWGADQMLGFGQVWSGSGYVKIFPPIPTNMRAKPSVSKSVGTGSVWFVSYQGNSGFAGNRDVTVEGNTMDPNPHTSSNVFRIFVHNGSNQGNGTTVMSWMHDTTGIFLRLDAEI